MDTDQQVVTGRVVLHRMKGGNYRTTDGRFEVIRDPQRMCGNPSGRGFVHGWLIYERGDDTAWNAPGGLATLAECREEIRSHLAKEAAGKVPAAYEKVPHPLGPNSPTDWFGQPVGIKRRGGY